MLKRILLTGIFKNIENSICYFPFNGSIVLGGESLNVWEKRKTSRCRSLRWGSCGLPRSDSFTQLWGGPICTLIPLPPTCPEWQDSWQPFLCNVTTPPNHAGLDQKCTPVPSWLLLRRNRKCNQKIPTSVWLHPEWRKHSPRVWPWPCFPLEKEKQQKPVYRQRNEQALQTGRGQHGETCDGLPFPSSSSSRRLHPCP